MDVDLNKKIAYSKNHGLIDPMIKGLVDYIDFTQVKVIYDIGSRDGLQSVELSKVFPHAYIYAFEANDESISVCYENVKNCNNIQVIHTALSDIDGFISFYAADMDKSRDKNIGISSMFKLMDETPRGWHWIQKEIKVPSITIDTMVDKGIPAPDLIWMDVQGAELLVLKGAKNTLSKIKAIFTEVALKKYYKGQVLYNEIDSFLTSMEFKNVLQIPLYEYESDFLYINNKL